jgi:dihydroorotate dehydrogenase (fumarate)
MMPDLQTTYLGMELRTPVVASSSPLTHEPDLIARLVDAGAGAVVLPSLFEEQIEHEATEIDRMFSLHADANTEASNFFPEVEGYESVVDRYLALVDAAVARVDVPVIASLNGTHLGGWVRYANLLESAGASAIELNLYALAADPQLPGQMIEGEQIALVELLTDQLSIPVAVKISPYYTSVAAFAVALEEAGADGISMFNRFYQPDLDLESLEVMARIALSTPEELRLPMRWIGILRDHLKLSLAATTGVHSGQDVAKVILAGADVAMTTSAVLRHGPEHVATMLQGLKDWMNEHEYESVRQMRGAISRGSSADPEAYERANYIGNLAAYTSQYQATHRPAQ